MPNEAESYVDEATLYVPKPEYGYTGWDERQSRPRGMPSHSIASVLFGRQDAKLSRSPLVGSYVSWGLHLLGGQQDFRYPVSISRIWAGPGPVSTIIARNRDTT